MNLGFSKTLAIIVGTALPLLGIVRTRLAPSDPVDFFEDLIAGAFLLVGAWRVGVAPHSGQRYLAAAWGLTIGLFYYDLYTQIQALSKPVIGDVTFGPEWSVAAAGIELIIAIVGLITCLRSTRSH
jgi:hypothetical protein